MAEPIIWKDIRVQIKGHIVRGSYNLSRSGIVTVKTQHGSKTARLSGLSAATIAKILPRELAAEGKA